MDERGEKAQSSGKRSTMCRTQAIIQRTLWKYSRKIRLMKKEKKVSKYNDSTIKRGRYRLSETMLPGVARPVYGVLLRTSPPRLEPVVPGKSRGRKFNRRSPSTDIFESRQESRSNTGFLPTSQDDLQSCKTLQMHLKRCTAGYACRRVRPRTSPRRYSQPHS